MLKVKLNERVTEVEEGTTLFALRDAVKPDADVVIYNGAAMGADTPLSDGDEVCLIKRGEAPSEDIFISKWAIPPCVSIVVNI